LSSLRLPAALALAVSGVSVVNLRLMHGVIGKLATDSLPRTYSIGRLSGIAKDIRGGIRGHITSDKRADKLKADADLAALAKNLRDELSEYEKSISSAPGPRIIRQRRREIRHAAAHGGRYSPAQHGRQDRVRAVEVSRRHHAGLPTGTKSNRRRLRV
jgi:hypothetical protein